MHLAEIIILIIGAVLFTASFFMPDKGGASAKLDEEEERKAIKELLDKEVEGARFQIEEAAMDCVNENRDRMERALDRITNEKMSAVDEYSNTVLDQIHKNHDEVMFLYDMLNNKHTQVKNTAAELNQITKSAKVAVNAATTAAEPVKEVVKEPVKEVQPKDDTIVNPEIMKQMSEAAESQAFTAIAPPKLTKPGEIEAPKTQITQLEQPKKKEEKKTEKAKAEKTPVAGGNIELMFASNDNSVNNNDKILALHKEGKSNMAIAKELGLGIGEVKLVIDLFEGI